MIVIWDMDETIINSAHRTPNNADGTLNLERYIALHSRKNVFKDKHLPLLKSFKKVKSRGFKTVICTARDMKKCDYDYLNFHGIKADLILSRETVDVSHYRLSDGEYKLKHLKDAGIDFKNAIMIDDSSSVKKVLRRAGLTVLCAHKLNKKLASVA